MRRSGETTRLIDIAVQMLFTDGEITIPTATDLYFNDGWRRGLSAEQIQKRMILIDPDSYRTNRAQEFFFRSLTRRLNTEHYGMFEQHGNTFRVIKK